MHTAENERECPPRDQWHALYTRHQHEKTVAQSLSSKGHDIFLPIYGTVHRWQDRTKQLLLPLFPSYVFIRGGMDRQLQILSTPGLISIVGWMNGCPAIIPQEQIDAVRLIVQGAHRFEPHPFLTCGDRIRVRNGPLRGVEGVLVRKKGLARLVVSMEMLGRAAAVEINVSDIARIEPLSY
ncbi:MAG: UpxY family transcription antiterminator [Candidatus Acidiferrales bacterium]|jgi:transcription antitermination factor NusG